MTGGRVFQGRATPYDDEAAVDIPILLTKVYARELCPVFGITQLKDQVLALVSL